jgi:hypothetical protein
MAQEAVPLPPARADWIDACESALDSHVLIIGDNTLELICSLIRRGCPSASSRKFNDRVTTESVETVLIPEIRCAADAACALALAARALLPLGRVFFHLQPNQVHEVEYLLRRHGFSALRHVANGDTMVLSGELAIFERQDWANRAMTYV